MKKSKAWKNAGRKPAANVNRKHKDSVFSFLFSNPDALRELYSAIEGVDLPPGIPISINTLSDVLIKGQLNDVSFTIDNRLIVLAEHQSTLGENLPLRILEYTGRAYEKIIDFEKRFQRKLEKIPRPKFIVLYNGKEPFPDYKEMRLSDAFMEVEGLKLPGSGELPLELIVHVYNINHGRNPEILNKSKTLGSYSLFIDKIREYQKNQLPLDESFKAAIQYCIDNDVLKDFLKRNSSEVMNMLYGEYRLEDEIAFVRKESREEGKEEAREEDKRRVLELVDQDLSADEMKQRLIAMF